MATKNLGLWEFPLCNSLPCPSRSHSQIFLNSFPCSSPRNVFKSSPAGTGSSIITGYGYYSSSLLP